MSILQGNFLIRSGSYNLENDAYLFEVYFKNIILCEVLFYDENIDKKMTIKFFNQNINYDFIDFYKSLDIIIKELTKIIKQKKINKNIF